MYFNLEIKGEIIEKGDTSSLYTFKFDNGRGFPKSYIEFVEKYGYGLSCNSIFIYIPMEQYGDSFFVQNPIFKARFLDVLDWGNPIDLKDDILYPDGNLDLLTNAEPFAKSNDGEYFFWDIYSGENQEFDIYITDFRGIGFTKVASNLYEFFEKITSLSGFKEVLPFNQNPLVTTFEPLKRVD